jgi:hypothetical protein
LNLLLCRPKIDFLRDHQLSPVTSLPSEGFSDA